MASKLDLATVTTKLYQTLKALEPEDRQKAMSAVLVLLGDAPVSSQNPVGAGSHGAKNIGAEASAEPTFFENKNPENKIEELAVAARYREIKHDLHVHTKEELQTVVKNARRNFDSVHFKRDLDNAKRKGLFTKDREIKLAYYGQQYIDALPDREKVKELNKPRSARRSVAKK